MMSKKIKKKKKKHLCPPLSALDKGIYSAIFTFAVFIILATAIWFEYTSNSIAFGHTGTVAYRKDSSFLFALPFLLHILIAAFVIVFGGWDSKTPIFGNRNIRYGEYPYKKDCVPIFQRKKYNIQTKPSQKKFICIIAALWCVFLIIFASIIPLGLYGRTALYEDNHIEKYNLINSVTDTYTSEDFDSLTITAQRYVKYTSKGRHRENWQFLITIKMNNGEECSFANDNFDLRNEYSTDTSLDKMIKVKNLFEPEDITIEGINYLDKVTDYLNLNKNQQEKLNELFGQ